jgi:ABC-type multidrug transport system ATPase subunit
VAFQACVLGGMCWKNYIFQRRLRLRQEQFLHLFACFLSCFRGRRDEDADMRYRAMVDEETANSKGSSVNNSRKNTLSDYNNAANNNTNTSSGMNLENCQLPTPSAIAATQSVIASTANLLQGQQLFHQAGENSQASDPNHRGGNGKAALDAQDLQKRLDTFLVLEDPRDRFMVAPLKVSNKVTLQFHKVKYVGPATTSQAIQQTLGIGYGDNFGRTVSGTGDEAEEVIIQGISGTVAPGQSLCILDGQFGGAGITLLQVLAGRVHTHHSYAHAATGTSATGGRAGTVFGSIRANGTRLRSGLTIRSSAYVSAGDISKQPISVRDTIRYAVLLRRGKDNMLNTCCNCCCCITCCCPDIVNDDADYKPLTEGSNHASVSARTSTLTAGTHLSTSDIIEEKVNEILRLAGLMDVADVVIASTTHTHTHTSALSQQNTFVNCNLAPGQLRCLTIAVELLNDPGLIFLEDPFCGLDWVEAEYVGVFVQTLTQMDRAIVASLSAPSHRVHVNFTDTILLGTGLMLYCGPSSKAVSYFENIGDKLYCFIFVLRPNLLSAIHGFIGFERQEDDTPLRFLMKIGTDMGVMKEIGGRRTVTMSHEDLADICKYVDVSKCSSQLLMIVVLYIESGICFVPTIPLSLKPTARRIASRPPSTRP